MRKLALRGHDLLGIFFLCSLAGCAYGVKAIPDDVKAAVTPGLIFNDVIQNPKGAIGKTILWGGTIIETTVNNEESHLEILQKPLGKKDRPLETDESYGRFLVVKKGVFLDPAVYQEGREVTIVGKIIEEREKPIGELIYRYPYILASYIHLWSKRPLYETRYYPVYPNPYWVGPYPYYIYPYPYWYGNPFFRPGPSFRRFPPHIHNKGSSD